jgi:hypothetical protein
VILGELNNALQDQKSQQVLADIRSVRQQYLDSLPHFAGGAEQQSCGRYSGDDDHHRRAAGL